MLVSKDKQYQTRDGREVRIYAVDGGSDYPIHGAYWEPALCEWILCRWNLNGLNLSVHPGLNLIEVKPRIQREFWVNVYPENFSIGEIQKSKKTCDLSKYAYNRIACVKITIDCEEGEGL